MAWTLYVLPVLGTGSSRLDPRRPKYVAAGAGAVPGDLGIYGTPKVMTGASNASPIVVTATSHGFVSGQAVHITEVLGNLAANNNWYITVTDANVFSLNGSQGNGAYLSGGLVTSWLFWSMIDYGRSPWCLMAADSAPFQHTFLTGQADVRALPSAIDDAIGGANIQAVRDYLEAAVIPATWATGSTTWRELIRMVGGLFQFAHRYAQISRGAMLIPAGVSLNDQFGSLTADQRDWFFLTCTSLGYSTSSLTLNAPLRTILKDLADAWGSQPLPLGGLSF